jgi:lysophospholipase L1-like esterase
MITQALRRVLQLRNGSGGRGVLPPGRPYAGYLTFGVTATQSAGWTVSAAFGPGSPGSRPVGLSGFTQTSTTAGASIGLVSDDRAHLFDRITVCALKEPGAGSVRLRIGAHEERWTLASVRSGAACRSVDSDSLASESSVTAEDRRPVSIVSFATFRREGGVVVSNLGVSGSHFVHLARQDEALVRAELDAYRPDLVVLAFGTNEGFSPRFDAAAYEAGLRSGIGRIRRLSDHAVPILLAAPPDAATRNATLAANGGPPGAACADGVFVPSALDRVREIQRRVAADLGLGFHDMSEAMGGPCSAVAWSRRGWMRPDLVHFTRAGGEQLGWAIISALLQDGAEPPRRVR